MKSESGFSFAIASQPLKKEKNKSQINENKIATGTKYNPNKKEKFIAHPPEGQRIDCRKKSKMNKRTENK